MELEESIFEKAKPIDERMLAYGFKKQGDTFHLDIPICQGMFRAEIEVKESGKVSGKVIDTASETNIPYYG